MSNSFNFVGTIGRDAEVKHLSSGSAILTVTVANNVGYGDKQKTNWVRVTLFGKRAEGNLSGLLVKGQQVFVSGELTLNEYQTKDGSTKSNLEVNANIIDLVGGKREQVTAAKPKPVIASDDDFDDSIPF
jgi:single-strand DNA-binding protein